MNAWLASLDTEEGDDLDGFVPGDASAFRVVLNATVVHPSGGSGVFRFDVVGPDWFARNPAEKGFRWGRGLLVVDRWDPGVVRRAIEDQCRRVGGQTWSEIEAKLELLGHAAHLQSPANPARATEQSAP